MTEEIKAKVERMRAEWHAEEKRRIRAERIERFAIAALPAMVINLGPRDAAQQAVEYAQALEAELYGEQACSE